MNPSRAKERGSALIIVLILMTVTISLALYTVSLSREIVSSSQNLQDKLQARLESGSLVEKLHYIGSTGRFTSWNLENINAYRDIPLLLNLRGTPLTIGNSQVRLQDSAGRLGIWPPHTHYLAVMLRNANLKPGVVDVAVDSLLDWNDQDDLKHLNGAESYFYRSQSGLPYLPRNDRFIQTVGELELIRGWRGEVFESAGKEIMESSATSNFNLNTADAPLLSALLNINITSARNLVVQRERTGSLSYDSVMALAPNALTNAGETITSFPSLAVEINIRTTIGAASDALRTIVNFQQQNNRPFTVEVFND